MDSSQALSEMVGRNWPVIEKARGESESVRNVIAGALKSDIGRLAPDIDFVLFGSLARQEWTSGIDVDWMLLIDGQADPNHQRTSQEVQHALANVEFNCRNL